MTRRTKTWLKRGALLVVVAILAGWAVKTYFSPYQECLRSMPHDPLRPSTAKERCAYLLSDR